MYLTFLRVYEKISKTNMCSTEKLKNVTSLCRICLTQSKNMISFNTTLDSTEKAVPIIRVLEEVIGTTVSCEKGYPEVICPMCLGLLKISYNLKIQFKKSEKILQRHFRDISDPLSLENEVIEKTDEPSNVEIIIGPNKYDLKDILIVEEDKSDRENFKGFLDNLGKVVTAKFVSKSTMPTKTVQEENPVVLIKKLKSRTKDHSVNKQYDVKCLDQYIITKDEQFRENYIENIEKASLNLEELGMENLTDLDIELFKSALNMQLKCDICGKLYSSRGRFRKHIETCSSKLSTRSVVPLKCNLCSRTFKQKKFLNYHIRTTHSVDPSRFKCELCGQILRNRNILTYHKLTKHGDRKFMCDICDKKFFTSNCLKAHLLRHTQRNSAQCVCPVCGKTFHYKGGLYYHMKLHTNERKYCCDFCDRKFYTLYAKKRHTLTHTGIRPYACKYCEKRFFSTGERRKHEYLHTGVRPYSCQYCKKGFCSSYNMKVHLVSHPGPYQCKMCDRTFVNMNILQFHHRTKHSSFEEVEKNSVLIK